MELPRRHRGDELLKPGEMTALRSRLRNLVAGHDLATVIAYAFDFRTRMLPFFYADMQVAPAGPRAIGSALVDVGLPKTRIVLQQWNRHFRPSQMQLDGRSPDMFMISAMLLHSASCEGLIRDACRIDPARRPLIIAGGPRVIYEPWSVFSADPQDPWGADVAVTGEEFVLLSLLEVLLSFRAGNEPMRSAFQRARDAGALDDIPGLVYAKTDARGVHEELVDTGVQRLLGDMDELPHPALGYALLEPPSDRPTLGPHAIAPGDVRRFSRVASLVLTQGCRFRCNYCPIPAYNQHQCRGKSGQRIADEIERLYHDYGIRMVFGADDNFFADEARAVEITETLARKVDAGSKAHCKVQWSTEVTVHGTLKLKHHLPEMRKAGLRWLWLGVEDLSGTLVRKGQDGDRTLEAFRLLRQNGIYPIPMMMHHDDQPLWTWKDNRGLVNQIGLLRKAGALYMMLLMLTPARGSKTYEEFFTSGLAYESAGDMAVEPAMISGMHVVASRHPRPWIKQLTLLAGYVYFFNPLRLLWALVFSKSRIPLIDAETWPPPALAATQRRPALKRFTRWLKRKTVAHLGDAAMQLFGIWGLALTVRRTAGWTWRLIRGPIKRCSRVPASPIPMRDPQGGPASHALPGTLLAITRPAPRSDRSWTIDGPENAVKGPAFAQQPETVPCESAQSERSKP